MSESVNVVELEAQYLLQNYSRHQIVIARGDGPYMWDIKGKRYLDFIAGIGVNALGQNHPRIVAAISEQDMEPFFRSVEARISVAHQDPETIGTDMRLLKAGADAKGWKVIPNLRNQLHCAGTNNCTNGCPTGAKRSMLVTSIPRALARGARLFADCRVERITCPRR